MRRNTILRRSAQPSDYADLPHILAALDLHPNHAPVSPPSATYRAPGLLLEEQMSGRLHRRAEHDDMIASYLPSWQTNTLPGSFAHLLYSLFGPFEAVVKLQQSLDNIPEYFQQNRHRALFANQIRNFNREPKNLKCGATFAPQLPSSQDGEWCRKSDEFLFSHELQMLRNLVEPLRDTSKPIYWITDRVESALEMDNGFLASKELIADFKKDLSETAWNRRKNYTIYDPRPDWDEQQKETKRLREYRLQACKGTLYWDRWPPVEEQYDRNALAAKQFIIDNDPKAAEILGFLPPENSQPPAALISTQPGIELACIIDLEHYDDQITIVLIRISQWLALARGFPVVHLFCDIVRLFTIYGVDVANAVQVELCKHLTGLSSFLWDSVELPPLFPCLESEIEAHELYPEEIRSQHARNCWAEQQLMMCRSLWCRDDNAIAWDYPLQTLVWGEKGDGRVLALRSPPF
ncbi:Pc16g10290 [Penicillium rubens Wisconsin 54-1255]|uniref:Pc16g10290 protein n=1 Tax=Penicillium rubens (strain ATCC 28089 / DSM 1075 / NRRL 1951 / Wisconsin 54-1255) TaxID=500485 RepID=B6H9E5_PENRW|nr:Pc16g10290 [Penicillium rubens Wisconsin 54-1255]